MTKVCYKYNATTVQWQDTKTRLKKKKEKKKKRNYKKKEQIHSQIFKDTFQLRRITLIRQN